MFIHIAGPNTALVKSSGEITIGGRIFVLPILQRVDTLSLNLRTLTIRTEHGTTINGVGVDVTSCCQVKIQGWAPSSTSATLQMDKTAIRLAGQHFIGRTDDEIEDTISKTVAGHQRAIIGVLTVEELYRDRQAFSRRVRDHCEEDMRNMGLTIVSYTVAEISDEQGYIEALGVTQLEKVKRAATEGAAHHRESARSKKGEYDARAHLIVNEQHQRAIESNKRRDMTAADAQRVVDRQKAIQRKARAIATAEQDSVLLVARQKACAAAIEAERVVMKWNVEKHRLVKEGTVNVEADARLYQARVGANANRVTNRAEADRVKAVGVAEAHAIRERGRADTEVLRERVKMWNECVNETAIVERMIEKLPEIASAIAAPLEKAEKMVFIGSGDDGNAEQAKTERSLPNGEPTAAAGNVDVHRIISAMLGPDFADSELGKAFKAGAEGAK